MAKYKDIKIRIVISPEAILRAAGQPQPRPQEKEQNKAVT